MSERIFSGVIALLAVVMFILAMGYAAPIAYDPIGPRPYPMILLALLALLTGIVAFRPAKFAQKINLGLMPHIIKHLIICTIAMTLYALLFETLGYIIATVLMSWIVGVQFGGTHLKAFVVSVIMAVSTYFLFNGPLEVSLPAGLLSFVL